MAQNNKIFTSVLETNIKEKSFVLKKKKEIAFKIKISETIKKTKVNVT